MLKDNFNIPSYIENGIPLDAPESNQYMAALSPFLRTLLVTDGTVTKSLEAYFWEPVVVEKLSQEYSNSANALTELQLTDDEKVLRREVLLRGSQSQNIYAYASSLVRTDMLDTQIRDNLLNNKIGIGELLREIGLETYREIISFGQADKLSLVNQAKSKEIALEHVYRTYLIHIGGDPAIQITEKFPLAAFK